MTVAEQSTEHLTDLKKRLETRSLAEPQIIPIELLSANGKLAKIINNTDAQTSLLMRDEDYEIKLVRPIYVTKIAVTLTDYEDVRGMRLIASDLLSGKPVKTSITAENFGSEVTFNVKATLTSFILQKGGIFSKKLKRIQVFGIQPEDIEKFEQEFCDLVETKNRIVALAQEKADYFARENATLAKSREETTARLDELDQEITDLMARKASLEEKVEELTGSIGTLEESLKQKQAEHAILSAAGSELEKRKLGVESELAQKSETLANTNINISKREEKLKELVNNVNVFSEEFSGFVDQGTKQVKIYIGLALIPLMLLCTVVYNLFQGAVDLSLKFEKIPNIDLITLFATRLPFVTIAALIVGVSVRMFFFLVNRIISIHQQRLELAKIAIIAKDVSDASANGLRMSTKEIYEEKTYLKMNILKAYLSEQISSFSYPRKKVEAGPTTVSSSSTTAATISNSAEDGTA